MPPTATNTYTAAIELTNDGNESTTFSARDDLKRTHLMQTLPTVSLHDVASASHSGDTYMELSTTKALYTSNANVTNSDTGACTSTNDDTNNSTFDVGQNSTTAHNITTKQNSKQNKRRVIGGNDNATCTKLTDGVIAPGENLDESFR